MASPSNAPLTLYEANLALSTQIGVLMQHSGQQWIAANASLYSRAVADSAADVSRLTKREPGAPSSNALSDLFWQQVKRRSAGVAAAGGEAIDRQRSFVDGCSDAMRTWGTTVDAIRKTQDTVAPFGGDWVTAMTKWTQAWPMPARTR